MNVECDMWIEYTEATDLGKIMDALEGRWMCIGAGSNMLFTDRFKGTLLHSRILDVTMTPGSDSDVSLVRAGAGVEMDSLISQLCSSGLWGLENLSGIPGEVGSSVVQNVGAYGVEAKDVVERVECYDTLDRKFVSFDNTDCCFGYRNSLFKQSANKGRYIVTYVTFRLSSTPAPILDYGHLNKAVADIDKLTPSAIREVIIGMRNAKLPNVEHIGSAGSFFKNPVISESDYAVFLDRVMTSLGVDVVPPHFEVEDGVKLSAAWLIDRAGLKGESYGGASTWHTQPLVIVNSTGTATASDILGLESLIVGRVYDLFGIELVPEVEHVN